jgi:hypothetical protein
VEVEMAVEDTETFRIREENEWLEWQKTPKHINHAEYSLPLLLQK